MEWFPIVFFTFKILVLGTGMFFAIKWHYDQGQKDKDKQKEMRAVLRAGAKIAVAFLVAVVVLGVATFALGRKLGLDLNFS